MPLVFIALMGLLLTGCWRDDMSDDGHAKPMESSEFFADGKLARPLINGTVPRSEHPKMVNDTEYAVTPPPATEATKIPIAITQESLARGQQEFAIFCTPCHGALGNGEGMIVHRGFPHPPAFYPVEEHKTSADQAIRNLYPREVTLATAPPGHFYNVITHGYGAMYSYGDRISEKDRWKIVAYVRALQITAKNARPAPTPQQASTSTTQPAAAQ